MKLDRNINDDGLGKYAIINLRRLNELYSSSEVFHRWTPQIEAALKLLEDEGLLDWGQAGTDAEFFLIRLKDRSAEPALRAYATDACQYDQEWAREVFAMADRAKNHPAKKTPD